MEAFLRYALGFVILGMSAAVAHASVRVELALRNAVIVQGQWVRIGDLADLKTDDHDAMRHIAQLVVGEAPPAGDLVVVESKRLMSWLTAKLSGRRLAAITVVWTGAKKVEIRSAEQKVFSSQIESLAKEELQRWLLDQGAEIVFLAPLSRHRVYIVGAGELLLKPKSLAASVSIRRRMKIWVDIYVDRVLQKTVPVDIDLKASKQVAVARRDLAAGETLSALTLNELLNDRAVDIAAIPSGAATLEYWRNYVAERPRDASMGHALRLGEPLSDSHIKTRPDVVRGSNGVLRSNTAGISIERAVDVLQDGLVGQTVRVRLAGRSRTLLVRVVKQGEFEVIQ